MVYTRPEMGTGEHPKASAASEWLRNLEVARRLQRFYPGDHPSLAPARERLLAASDELGCEPLILGVRPSGFFVDDDRIEGRGQSAARLAAQLFQIGVIALRVLPPLPAETLDAMVDLFAGLSDRPTEEDREETLAAGERLRGVDLVPFDVSQFVFGTGASTTASSGEGSALWKLLVERMTGGTLSVGGEGGVSPADMAGLTSSAGDPVGFVSLLVDRALELLAEADHNGAALQGLSFMAAIAEMLRGLDPGQRQLAARLMIQRSGPPGSLQARLPELFPADLVLDAVVTFLASGIEVPEAVQELVYELAAPVDMAHDPWRRRGLKVLPETVDRARALLARLPGVRHRRAEPLEPVRRFVDHPGLRRLLEEQPGGEYLAEELTPGEIRHQRATVLREARRLWPHGAAAGPVAEQLVTLYFEQLELGEFELGGEIAGDLLAGEDRGFRRRLSSREGLEALLGALSEWGKAHRSSVMGIVARLGGDIVPAVVDRLETEERLSVRRRLLEMAVVIGAPAIPALRLALANPRWYVVRNALLLLSRLKDEKLPDRAAEHIGHGDPRVVAQAVKALVAARDERWILGLRRLLDSDDPLATREALTLARLYRHPEVGRMLLIRLRSTPRARLREPESLALIETLGGFPAAEVAQELESLARLPQWRFPYRLTPVWQAVARAASRLPAGSGRPILEQLARVRDTAVAAEARRRLAGIGEAAP